MKRSFVFAAVMSLFAMTATVFSQDDESRQQSGLPTYIGSRPGPNTANGADATLSGSFTVQGTTEGNMEPTFTVAVLAHGVLVARQRVKNKSGFSFNNVPRDGVSLIAEADGLEIGNYQIGQLNPPPIGNRYDIIVSSSQLGVVTKPRNEVVSVRNSYRRTDANQAQFDRAMALVKENKRDVAEKDLIKLVADDAADFVAWTELGSIYFTMEKYGDAETAYNKALALKADLTPAMLNLGKLDIRQKKFDAAVDILKKALATAPDSADINHYLGEAYLQIKKGSLAVPLLNRAIELDPKGKADLHLRLAQLYIGAKLNDRAAAEYKLFLDQVPNYDHKADLEKFIKENPPR